MEAKKSFIEASTSGSQDKVPAEVDPSVLTTILENCMKLLRNKKAVKVLDELINRGVGKDNTSDGPYIVKNIGKHKARRRREMRLTTQIGDYEIDQVILDLGSDVNVLPK